MNKNQKSFFEKVKERQIIKFKKKGLTNSLISFIFLFIVIYGGTNLGRLIWPENIQNRQLFIFIISWFLHIFLMFANYFSFAPGYSGNQSYKPYEINKTLKKPWQKQNWDKMKKRTTFYLFINKIVVYPIVLYLSLKISGTKLRFSEFPSVWQVFTQLMIIMYVEEFFFYACHKISHGIPFLYKFHKIHHQYEVVFSLSTEYTHPIDYMFGNLLPSAIPLIVLGSNVHCFMFFFWQIWKVYISTQAHCGYEFPWSPTRILPLVAGASYHDFHHTNNIGNFGASMHLWDTIFNSNDQYWDKYFSNVQSEQNQKSLTNKPTLK